VFDDNSNLFYVLQKLDVFIFSQTIALDPFHKNFVKFFCHSIVIEFFPWQGLKFCIFQNIFTSFSDFVVDLITRTTCYVLWRQRIASYLSNNGSKN